MKKEEIIVQVPAQSLHLENARCPAGHTLMDPKVLINGFPSVRVMVCTAQRRGIAHLDPVYGSFHNICDIDVPEGEVVEMLCPACQTSLQAENTHCEYCFSPMFSFALPNGGSLDGCLKNGCRKHRLRLVDLYPAGGKPYSDDHIQLLM